MRSSLGLLVVSLKLFLAAAWDYSQNGFDWSGLGQCGGESDSAAAAANPLALDAEAGAEATSGNKLQSPINLPKVASVNENLKVLMKYPNLGQMMKLYNNGKSLALTIPEDFNSGFGLAPDYDTTMADGSGDTFRLAQVNFHSPSEHELDGKRMPLEMQLVHKQSTGSGDSLAVVSILFAPGSEAHNTFLDVIIGNGLPDEAWEEADINHGHYASASEGLDLFDTLRQVLSGSQFYSYTGSLTSPPCDPGVKYFVKKAPAPAHAAQLEQFQRAMKKTCPPYGNFRRIPAFTTAGDSVEVLQSVDTIGGGTSSSGGSKGSVAASPVTVGQRERVLEDPQYQSVGNNDTETMKTAKTNFQAANLNHAAAVTANSNAKQSLSTAEQQLGLASGVADKLDRTWKVFAAQTAVTDTAKSVSSTQQKLDETIKVIIDIEKEAQANATAAAPEQAAETAPAAPTVQTFVPTGQAGNPFASVDAAETVPRVGVGAGLAKTASPRLGPNLRPDGPHVPASVQAATVATVAVDKAAAAKASEAAKKKKKEKEKEEGEEEGRTGSTCFFHHCGKGCGSGLG